VDSFKYHTINGVCHETGQIRRSVLVLWPLFMLGLQWPPCYKIRQNSICYFLISCKYRGVLLTWLENCAAVLKCAFMSCAGILGGLCYFIANGIYFNFYIEITMKILYEDPMFWYGFILLHCTFRPVLIGHPVTHICLIDKPTKFGRLLPNHPVYAQMDCAVLNCLNSL